MESETDLELVEMHHICPEKALAQLLAGKDLAEAQFKRR